MVSLPVMSPTSHLIASGEAVLQSKLLALAPIIKVATKVEGGHLVIDLEQVQKLAWGRYRLPNLEIKVAGRTIRIAMLGRTARTVTHWDGDGEPQVEVDPNTWWLLDVAKP